MANPVDAAAGARAIADSMMYGLLEGGTTIDVARCDWILEEGRKRGVTPSRTATELGLEFVAAHNAKVDQEKPT